MHLRYDLKNKLDLGAFEKQSSFFLTKEDCVFSFYLSDLAVSFDVLKELDFNPQEDSFSDKIITKVSISEMIKNNSGGEKVYNIVNPLQDPRFSQLSLIKEIFDSNPQGTIVKNSKQETIDFIIFMVKIMNKINRLSVVA